MKLTQLTNDVNLYLHCNSGVGRENPFRQGDNTPLSTVVFLRPQFFDSPNLGSRFNIMMVLFEQPFWLVAPCRGILTSFNTVANTVRSMRDGFTNFRQGITA